MVVVGDIFAVNGFLEQNNTSNPKIRGKDRSNRI